MRSISLESGAASNAPASSRLRVFAEGHLTAFTLSIRHRVAHEADRHCCARRPRRLKLRSSPRADAPLRDGIWTLPHRRIEVLCGMLAAGNGCAVSTCAAHPLRHRAGHDDGYTLPAWRCWRARSPNASSGLDLRKWIKAEGRRRRPRSPRPSRISEADVPTRGAAPSGAAGVLKRSTTSRLQRGRAAQGTLLPPLRRSPDGCRRSLKFGPRRSRPAPSTPPAALPQLAPVPPRSSSSGGGSGSPPRPRRRDPRRGEQVAAVATTPPAPGDLEAAGPPSPRRPAS